MLTHDCIDAMVVNAISADRPDGLINQMGRLSATQKDIPMAFEMLTLLQYHQRKLALQDCVFDDDSEASLQPGIAYEITGDAGKLLMKMPYDINSLQHEAHWIVDRFASSSRKALAGLLALPFMLMKSAEGWQLMPDWTVAVIPDDHGVRSLFPILTFGSMVELKQIGADWVPYALHRLAAYGLPVSEALAGINEVIPLKRA